MTPKEFIVRWLDADNFSDESFALAESELRAMIQEEREACAKVADRGFNHIETAILIRERGKG
jgi:hypothetical protein